MKDACWKVGVEAGSTLGDRHNSCEGWLYVEPYAFDVVPDPNLTSSVLDREMQTEASSTGEYMPRPAGRMLECPPFPYGFSRRSKQQPEKVGQEIRNALE
jgi:hypothetical protein